jgi:hypothetical protein
MMISFFLVFTNATEKPQPIAGSPTSHGSCGLKELLAKIYEWLWFNGPEE